jgi:hypothetical protein
LTSLLAAHLSFGKVSSLIELSFLKKKKIYCAFIDFTSAFDKVWRVGLWRKLLSNHISGKCLNVIIYMYNGCKSRICHNHRLSDIFPCQNGVRQGVNLSPLLFALYLNDLENFPIRQNVIGLRYLSEEIENELELYLKMMIMLYADDTVLLSETRDDLQYQLNCFQRYCEEWKQHVNIEKIKIMIFGKGRQPSNLSFFKIVIMK